MNRQKEISREKHHDSIAVEKITADFYSRVNKTGLTGHILRRFRTVIYDFYRKNAREQLPWRNTDDPYHILVSEIMLQQTQIERVLQKYPLLIKKYPDFQSLSGASLRQLYAVWQGMGYNRRALALKKIAGTVMDAPYYGRLPSSVEELVQFPGIGRATACAVASFAFHEPVVFIETNIRRVFIHFFFPGKDTVSDREILPLVEKSLDGRDPRNWYYALMDYGSMLRKLTLNPNRKSAGYKKQPPFAGSNRQLRGRMLKLLMEHSILSRRDLTRKLVMPADTVGEIADQLCREGFIKKSRNTYRMV